MSNPHPGKKLLLVDDNPEFLRLLELYLETEPYELFSFGSAEEALPFLDDYDFAAIISDQFMPGLSGLEFLQIARPKQPFSSFILVTGNADRDTAIEAVNSGEIFRFISKPFRRQVFLDTLQRAIEQYDLHKTNRRLQAETRQLNEQLQQVNRSLEENVRELHDQQGALKRANEALEKNFKHSLDLCHRIIATYSPLLGKDTRAVVQICEHFCQSDELSAKVKRELQISSWLHNIGLVGVSRELLTNGNNRFLNRNERRVLESHPIVGQAIVSFLEDLGDVGQIIRAHHERWDGTGYPDGLRQDYIPMAARYLAVACAYVESKLPRHEAVNFIIDQSGKAFYPEAVRLFLKVTELAPLPQQVKEITLNQLREDMVIASDIHTSSGLLLLPESQPITRDILLRIQHHNLIDAITDRILVYVKGS